MGIYDIIIQHYLKSDKGIGSDGYERLKRKTDELSDFYANLEALLDIPEIRLLIQSKIIEMGDL